MNKNNPDLSKRALVWLIGLFALAFAGPAPAEPASDAAAQTPNETLADILEDDTARQALIEHLRRQAEEGDAAMPADATAPPVMSFSRRLAQSTRSMAQDIAAGFGEVRSSMAQLGITDLRANLASFGQLAADLAIVIAATVLGFLLLRRLARPGFGTLDRWIGAAEGPHLLRRVAGVSAALLLDFVVIALAWVGGYVLALFLLGEAGEMDTRQSMFLNAFLLIEVFKLAIRTLFASQYRHLRLLPLAAEDAAYWNLWLARVSGFIGYGLLLVVPIVNTNLSPALGRILAVLIMGLAFVYALLIVLQNRQSVRDKLDAYAKGLTLDAARLMVAILARSWHLRALAYFAALAILTLTRPETALTYMGRATLQTLLAIGGGVFVSLLLSQVIMRRIQIPDETRRRFPLLEQRLNAFIPTALKVMRLIILVVIIALVLDAWQLIDLAAWLGSERGIYALGSLTSVAIMLAFVTVLWIGLASWIEHRLNPETGGGEPSARQRTLLTIFRNAVAIALIIITSMMVLAELGVNIGPLIAGAGVLGLAIGFGAQKLVQDIITGVFIQLENAINTGDVVSAGGITGTAEKLTIRSLGIRDLAGTFHIIPFSSVDAVSNYMRGFAYHVGEYGVAYREDPDEVIGLLRDAFAELAAHPEHGPKIIGELEVHGVTALADSSVNVRVRIKTLPGNQWAIGREYNRLVKRHLDAAGVEIPFPHMTLYFGEDKQGKAPPAHLRIVGDAAADTEATPVLPDPEHSRANPKDRGDYDDED